MNNKTTWTGIAAAVSASLTILAGLPYQLGDAAEIIPSEWKPRIVLIGIVATLALKIWNAFLTADASVVAKNTDEIKEIKKDL